MLNDLDERRLITELLVKLPNNERQEIEKYDRNRHWYYYRINNKVFNREKDTYTRKNNYIHMDTFEKYRQHSPTAYADGLPREQFMDNSIKELWAQPPRIAGPAFTVKLKPGDHLMFHAAIYEAPEGSIIVADCEGDLNYAVAGGNVCGLAQKRGIKGFVIDGVIRDIEEIRDFQFPVFSRGIMAKPGKKEHINELNIPIQCGGVKVNPGDIVIADEEGIAVVPKEKSAAVLAKAAARTKSEEETSMEEWEQKHRAKIERLLKRPLKN